MKSHLDTTLTHNGQNDDNTVKDVPTIGEIVVSQRKEFQDELASEGHNEYEVYPVQDVLCLFWLIICFHHHGYHVKTDEYHDGNVKGLLSDEVKYHPLEFVL